jgi:hypothetical protein
VPAIMVEVEVNVVESCSEKEEPKMDTLALPALDKNDSDVSEEDEDGG